MDPPYPSPIASDPPYPSPSASTLPGTAGAILTDILPAATVAASAGFSLASAATSAGSLIVSDPPYPSPTASTLPSTAGAILTDILPAATVAASAGFSLASAATSAGFSIARYSIKFASNACVVTGTSLTAAGLITAGPALLASGLALDLTDRGVGLARDITLMAQDASKVVTLASLDLTAYGCELSGFQSGDGVRLFVSGDDADAASFVHAMVVAFLAEVPEGITLADMYAALNRLAVIHAKAKTGLPSCAGIPKRTAGVGADVRHFVRPAVAIYGNLPTAFLGITPQNTSPTGSTRPVSADASLDAFCRIANVPHANIVAHDLVGATYQPGYIVYADPSINSVVCVLRGTITFPADILTDMVCGIAEFPELEGDEGAHGGMLEAARRIAGLVGDVVKAALATHKLRRVVCTGHSLGAGVATLLSYLWGPTFNGAEVSCFAFGPPCTLTEKASRQASGFVTSVVCDADVVSRFGLATSVDLREALTALHQRGTGEEEADLEWLKENVMTEGPRLYPGGRVLWLDTGVPGDDERGRGGRDGGVAVYDADNCLFDHIALQPGMYRSHMPDFYLRSVEQCL